MLALKKLMLPCKTAHKEIQKDTGEYAGGGGDNKGLQIASDRFIIPCRYSVYNYVFTIFN